MYIVGQLAIIGATRANPQLSTVKFFMYHSLSFRIKDDKFVARRNLDVEKKENVYNTMKHIATYNTVMDSLVKEYGKKAASPYAALFIANAFFPQLYISFRNSANLFLYKRPLLPQRSPHILCR